MPEFTPTPEQEDILRHDPRCHARILAGPGTGKSTTTVSLIDRLLAADSPPRLRLLTFTRAATAELGQKVSDHPAAATLRPSTIHSFAISVLLRNPGVGGFSQPLRIPDSWEYSNIIRQGLAARARVSLPKLKLLVTEMASNWESLTPREHPGVTLDERTRFTGAWNEHREAFGYTLLQELPYALRIALRDHDDLEGLDFDLLVVDEYQDLNACDLEVLKRIAARGCSLIAVGDDDQSIYSFRRAAPEGIRRFLQDYPGARDYPLSITQRCGRNIIDWASHVIRGDPDRPADRPVLAPADGSPEGEVALLAFPGDRTEARGVATAVHGLIRREGLKPSEVLILLRGDYNGTFSAPIKEELTRYGIPFADPDAVVRLLEGPQNRFFLEMVRLLANPEDSVAWASLLALTRGIGDTFVKRIYERCVRNRSRFGPELLAAHREGFPDGPKSSASKATQIVREALTWQAAHPEPPDRPEHGWGNWMLSQAGEGPLPNPSEEFAELLRALDDITEPDQSPDDVFDSCDHLTGPQQDLGRYLSQIEPLGKDRALATSEGVRIMTMTGSKGLTVRATIIAGLEEGIVPRPDAQLAEERRVLYVAMTRAKHFLFATWAGRRRGPTARSGSPSTERRRHSTFLDGGPIESQDGRRFLAARFPSDGNPGTPAP